MDQADQEIAPQGKRARLRVGHVAEPSITFCTRSRVLLVEQRRAVDHPADGLLRHPGEARDIVDRGLARPLGHAGRSLPAPIACPPWSPFQPDPKPRLHAGLLQNAFDGDS
jgi:hypothetical protein